MKVEIAKSTSTLCPSNIPKTWIHLLADSSSKVALRKRNAAFSSVSGLLKKKKRKKKTN